jgi:hypothetical protein
MADRRTTAALIAVLVSTAGCRGAGGEARTALPFADPALVANATETATGRDGCATFRHAAGWSLTRDQRIVGFTPDPSLGPLPTTETGYSTSPKAPAALGKLECVTPERKPGAKNLVDGDRNEYRSLDKAASKSFRRFAGITTESTAPADGYVVNITAADGSTYQVMRVYVSNATRTCRLSFLATPAEMTRLEGQVRAAVTTLRCAD